MAEERGRRGRRARLLWRRLVSRECGVDGCSLLSQMPRGILSAALLSPSRKEGGTKREPGSSPPPPKLPCPGSSPGPSGSIPWAECCLVALDGRASVGREFVVPSVVVRVPPETFVCHSRPGGARLRVSLSLTRRVDRPGAWAFFPSSLFSTLCESFSFLRL